MAEGDELRDRFLEMLKGGGQDSGEAPTPPGAESPSAPDAAQAQGPAPVPVESTPEPAPLTFEQQPPPPEEVPAAMAALAAEPEPEPTPAPASSPPPAPEGDLMDLGHDALLQGTAISLRSISNRLAVISEGLKLIPALQNIASDLENLKYGEVAAGVDALITWAQGEEQALMGELEQRTAARQGTAPPQ